MQALQFLQLMKSSVSTLYFLHQLRAHKSHLSQLSFSFFSLLTLELNPKPQPYIPQFLSLAKILTQNPKNFRLLSQLNFLLSHTQSFDSVTSIAIVDGLCKLKKLNRAKSLFFHLKDNLKVSPFFAFSLVSDCLVKYGKFDHVQVQWGEIASGYGMDLSNYVINVCKCGDLGEIKRVCERVLMGSRVLGRQSYVALIGVLCGYDEGLMAKALVNEMYCRGFKVDGVTYIVMFQCFCKNGNLNEADWILRKMIKDGFDIDVCMYGSFMECLCKAGKFREASKLFTKLIKKDGFSGCKSESLKQGRRAIFQVKCKGAIPEMMVYEMYFRSLCAMGKLDDAEILLKKMMKKRSVPQVCVYGLFIKALFRAGREDDAQRFFEIECKKGLVCPNELARYVIVQLCEKGKADRAMMIFDDLTRKGGLINSNTVVLCNCLLGSLWSAGRLTQVDRFFQRMINGDLVPPNLATYELMVSGFCYHGNMRRALDIFDDMLSKNFPVDGHIYELIITSLCNQGWLGKAYEYLERMTKCGSSISYTMWKRMFHSMTGDAE